MRSRGERIAEAAEDVEFVVGAVVAVRIKAIAAVAAAFGSSRRRGCLPLVVALLHEVLHHFRQANRARLELGGHSTSPSIFEVVGDGGGGILRRFRLFRRRNPQHARELPVEEPPESRFQHRFRRICSNRLFSRGLGIGVQRLDLHRKRHSQQQTQKKPKPPLTSFFVTRFQKLNRSHRFQNLITNPLKKSLFFFWCQFCSIFRA